MSDKVPDDASPDNKERRRGMVHETNVAIAWGQKAAAAEPDSVERRHATNVSRMMLQTARSTRLNMEREVEPKPQTTQAQRDAARLAIVPSEKNEATHQQHRQQAQDNGLEL